MTETRSQDASSLWDAYYTLRQPIADEPAGRTLALGHGLQLDVGQDGKAVGIEVIGRPLDLGDLFAIVQAAHFGGTS